MQKTIECIFSTTKEAENAVNELYATDMDFNLHLFSGGGDAEKNRNFGDPFDTLIQGGFVFLPQIPNMSGRSVGNYSYSGTNNETGIFFYPHYLRRKRRPSENYAAMIRLTADKKNLKAIISKLRQNAGKIIVSPTSHHGGILQ